MFITLTFTEAKDDLKSLETAYSSRYPLPPPEYEQSHGSYGKHDSSYGAHGHDNYGWFIGITVLKCYKFF